MTAPRSDAEIADELDEIAARLAALTTSAGDADLIGRELETIRAQLRQLAEENAEVGSRLSESLGLERP